MNSPDSSAVPKDISSRVLRSLRRRKPLRRFLVAISGAVEKSGGKAFLAGGIVRDLADGIKGKDTDIMVSGIGFSRLGGILRSLPSRKLGIRRIVPVGKAFAVYKVRTAWERVEIDVGITRGIDAWDDCAHRDFTVNSLLFALHARNDRLSGDVVDFFGGIADLRRKLIRGVGNAGDRFREDPIRILRAIRQKNERIGYSIENKTWEAIRRAAPDLLAVSGERVTEEILRSLSADPVRTVDDLNRSGILALLLPEITRRSKGALARMKRRYSHLEKAIGSPLPDTVLLANILVDIRENGAGTEAVARRLRFPDIRGILTMLDDLSRLGNIRRMKNPHARAEAVFLKRKKKEHLLSLYEAVCDAAGRRKIDFRFAIEKAHAQPPMLSGKRLLELGIPAGPGMARILEDVREASLTGIVATENDAERLAVKLHRKSAANKGKTGSHPPLR